jgi:hypothetical protein
MSFSRTRNSPPSPVFIVILSPIAVIIAGFFLYAQSPFFVISTLPFASIKAMLQGFWIISNEGDEQ